MTIACIGRRSSERHSPWSAVLTLLLITTRVCRWGITGSAVEVVERSCDRAGHAHLRNCRAAYSYASPHGRAFALKVCTRI
jgi:hypothetical protein